MTNSSPKDNWKFAGNFVDVGTVATERLAALALRLPEDRWPQQRPETHLAEYLEPIVLVQEEAVDPLVDELSLAPLLAPVLRILAQRYGAGVPALISLVRLRAHTTVPHHRDGPQTRPQVWSRRTHTPLVTNSGVTFQVGEERRHIGLGEIVEINNWRVHGVANTGSCHRIHLIVDWTPFVAARRVA